MPRLHRQTATFRLLHRTASAGGALVQAPLHPPPEWFSDEAADAAPEQFTVYPDGRVAGIVAPAGRCLLDPSLGERGECWTAPRPRDGRGSTMTGHPFEEYAIANRARWPDDEGLRGTLCADGTLVATGVMAGAGGHVRGGLPRTALTAARVSDAYSDTGQQVARVRYVWSDTAGRGVGGVVAVGALWPEVDDRMVAEVIASATSIDYRAILDEGDYRLVGCCLVNIGGLPSRYVASLQDGGTVVVAGDELGPPDGAPAGGSVPAMPRRARYCTACPPATRAEVTAAFRAVTPAGPAWFAEVQYPGGVGAFCDVMTDPAGAELWVVHPVADGQIDDEQRVVVPAAEATLTGRRFEWVEAEDMAVLPDGVAIEEGEDDMAVMAGAGERTAAATAEVDLAAEVAALKDRLAPLERFVEDYVARQLDEVLTSSSSD